MSHIVGKWSQLRRLILGNAFTVPSAPKPAFYSDGLHAFLSLESNPIYHTKKDIGLLYKIDNDLTLNCLFKYCKLHPDYVEECKTFRGTYIMIRRPALEIVNFLKCADYDHPINKYVLCGKYGHGVTMVMNYIIHYAYMSEWLIVHIPGIIEWLTSKTERAESALGKGLIDLPASGSNWLSHFKNQNLNLIKKLDLRLQNDYIWNIQEENKKGESLLGFIDHGIARGKYSCDVIRGLLDEIKSYSKRRIVKTLVVIDNYSVIFHPGRKSSNPKYKFLSPSQLSFMNSIKNLAVADWHNGAVVLSCHAEKKFTKNEDHLPKNKLTQEGFEFLDPFVPIVVPPLTDLEMSNLLNFYMSEKWLLTSEGYSELKALSAGSIKDLKTICGPL